MAFEIRLHGKMRQPSSRRFPFFQWAPEFPWLFSESAQTVFHLDKLLERWGVVTGTTKRNKHLGREG